MQNIDIRQLSSKGIIDLEPYVHSESDIYTDYKVVYKIFKNMSREELNTKRKKVELLSTLEGIKELVLPKKKLLSNNRFVGYSMDYINADTLFKCQHRMDINDYLNLVSKISTTMKRIHERQIILGDVSPFNILVNNGVYYFVDLDSCMVKNMSPERVSYYLSDYCAFTNKYVRCNKNFDRLSFLLYFINYLFGLNLEDLPMYEFDKKSETLEFLKNIRNIVISLKTKKVNTQVPYLDEVLIKRKQLK